MRAVVQRVTEARVCADGRETGRISSGLLIYLGISTQDTDADLQYLSGKIAGLRIFRDENGNMNKSVVDVGGAALVISQFTIMGDVRRGKRPSFTHAMPPARAEAFYRRFIEALDSMGVPCATGIFGAMMEVQSINDGPVTILLDSQKGF